MQSSNRVLGDLARLASGAMSMAAGAKSELEQLIQQRIERFLNDKGWVAREEFDAVYKIVKKKLQKETYCYFDNYQLLFGDNLAYRHGRVKILTSLRSVFQAASFDMRQGYHLKT